MNCFSRLGGLTAVIWTDSIQVLIMVIGAFILMVMSKCACTILHWPKQLRPICGAFEQLDHKHTPVKLKMSDISLIKC